MKKIIECLLEAGILEEDIHKILDMIEEEYEIVDETSKELQDSLLDGRKKNLSKANRKLGIEKAREAMIRSKLGAYRKIKTGTLNQAKNEYDVADTKLKRAEDLVKILRNK